MDDEISYHVIIVSVTSKIYHGTYEIRYSFFKRPDEHRSVNLIKSFYMAMKLTKESFAWERSKILNKIGKAIIKSRERRKILYFFQRVISTPIIISPIDPQTIS